MNIAHTPETLKAWQAGLGLSESGMAAYVGVPLHTWRKWINGTRKPDAAPCALLDLLASLPDAAPALHALRLENAHKAAKPPRVTQVSTGRKKRASAPPAKPVTPPPGCFRCVTPSLCAVHGCCPGTFPTESQTTAPAPPWVHVTEAVPEWIKTEA